jgi:hypothetical protein
VNVADGLIAPVGVKVGVLVEVGIVPVGVVDVETVPVGVFVDPPADGALGFVGALLLSEQAKGIINPESRIKTRRTFFISRLFFIFRLDQLY